MSTVKVVTGTDPLVVRQVLTWFARQAEEVQTTIMRRKYKEFMLLLRRFLDAKIAPLEERWSPFKEDPLIPVDEESVLRTFARNNEDARALLFMARDWKGGRVPRKKIEEFSNGLLKRKTMANLDCKGEGPEGRSRFGRFVVYDKWKLVWWMFQRYYNLDKRIKEKTAKELLNMEK